MRRVRSIRSVGGVRLMLRDDEFTTAATRKHKFMRSSRNNSSSGRGDDRRVHLNRGRWRCLSNAANQRRHGYRERCQKFTLFHNTTNYCISKNYEILLAVSISITASPPGDCSAGSWIALVTPEFLAAAAWRSRCQRTKEALRDRSRATSVPQIDGRGRLAFSCCRRLI
jgi:hypothetical protein